MSIARVFLLFSVTLFAIIGFAAWLKSGRKATDLALSTQAAIPIEIELDHELHLVETKSPSTPAPSTVASALPATRETETPRTLPLPADGLPSVDRISELFSLRDPKLPIVQTIAYKSRVDWLKGRPAWLTDYSSHFKTSRHFIARSLNGRPDYVKQDLAEGDRFNILHPDKEISFYLLIDTSRCKMWFYALDHTAHERTLIKAYDVGLGRVDPYATSGLLTPLGKFALGEKIAVYKPKVFGYYNGERSEMIRIFGTRWIPFERELEGATREARGFGIHGSPWVYTTEDEGSPDESGIGKYESDGCIRLRTEDMEELFSIVISRPTVVELVRDFSEAQLPQA